MPQTQPEDSFRLSEIHSAVRDEVDRLARATRNARGMTTYPDPVCLDPIERRLLVRSIFAAIEADVFALKQWAVRSDGRGRLSAGEIAMAREESYEVTDSGRVKQRTARVRCLSSLRLAFDMWAKVHDIDNDLDLAGQGWADVQAALRVRDRLMHPKALSDLDVTDSEIRTALSGFGWFDTQLNLALDDAMCSLVGGKRLRLTSASS